MNLKATRHARVGHVSGGRIVSIGAEIPWDLSLIGAKPNKFCLGKSKANNISPCRQGGPVSEVSIIQAQKLHFHPHLLTAAFDFSILMIVYRDDI